MNQYEMIVIVVAIVMFAGILRAKYRHRNEVADPAREADVLRAKDEIKALRDRIAVLERIATDKESSLEREIERLRDR